jgi:hypothetical protein
MLTTVTDPLSSEEAPRQEPLKGSRESTSVPGLGDLGSVHGDSRGEHTDCSTCNESANLVSLRSNMLVV